MPAALTARMSAVLFTQSFDACVGHAPAGLTAEAKDHYERIQRTAKEKGISEKAAYDLWAKRDGLLVDGNTLY